MLRMEIGDRLVADHASRSRAPGGRICSRLGQRWCFASRSRASAC